MKTIPQLSPFKARLPAILALSVLAAFAAGLSGCASSGLASAGRTHEMGPPKSASRMSNESMPNYPGR